MLAGPEAAVVVRAGSTIVQGVARQATTSSQWPSLHAGLLELHAIVAEWCEAAAKTVSLIQNRLDDPQSSLPSPPRRERRGRTPISFSLGSQHSIYGQITQRLTSKDSLIKKLTHRLRKRAARRNLRNMMRVYCPELLLAFEQATDRRLAWVEANRAALEKAMPAQAADLESLRTWVTEAEETRQHLLEVRDALAALIRETYPMGHGPLSYS